MRPAAQQCIATTTTIASLLLLVLLGSPASLVSGRILRHETQNAALAAASPASSSIAEKFLADAKAKQQHRNAQSRAAGADRLASVTQTATDAAAAKPIRVPPVPDDANLVKALAGISAECAGRSAKFQSGRMNERDRCVIAKVASFMNDHVNIMDCKFSASTQNMCRKAGNGKATPWKSCSNRWEAYTSPPTAEKGDFCGVGGAGMDKYDGSLKVYDGIIFQSQKKVVEAPGHGLVAAQDILDKATKFVANTIFRDHCAVCATVAQAGLYVYKTAGLIGRLDIVSERYDTTDKETGVTRLGGAGGHVYLLYSSLKDAASGDALPPATRPTDPNRPCGVGGTSKSSCFAQLVDDWYLGLQPKGTEQRYILNMVNNWPGSKKPKGGLLRDLFHRQKMSYLTQGGWYYSSHLAASDTDDAPPTMAAPALPDSDAEEDAGASEEDDNSPRQENEDDEDQQQQQQQQQQEPRPKKCKYALTKQDVRGLSPVDQCRKCIRTTRQDGKTCGFCVYSRKNVCHSKPNGCNEFLTSDEACDAEVGAAAGEAEEEERR